MKGMKTPKDWRAKNLFSLAKRNHPLVLGVPGAHYPGIDFDLPEGVGLKQILDFKAIGANCLSFERNFFTKNGKMKR